MQPTEENTLLQTDLARDDLSYQVTKKPVGGGHAYYIGTEKVERVTTILGNIIAKGGGFDYWLKGNTVAAFQGVVKTANAAQLVELSNENPYTVLRRLPEDRTALDRGSTVHKAIEDGQFNPDLYPPDVRPYIQAASNFFIHEGPKTEAQELIVGSREHRYAGTLDWRGTYSHAPAILDFKSASKSGTKPYDSYYMQLAAYEAASVEQGYPPTAGQFIVMLYPDATYRVFESHATVEDWFAAVTWFHRLVDLRERAGA